MDQRKRKRLIEKWLGESCESLYFKYSGSDYFIRNRENLQDVFFYQQSRTKGQFYITYGIDCPKILNDLRGNEPLCLPETPKLLITKDFSGRLNQGIPYVCKHEDHIEKSALKVCEDLKTEAIPWFESHLSETDVVESYRKSEIRLLEPSQDIPPGKILRWTMYGLLLHDIGEPSKASVWLERALLKWKLINKPTAQDKEWVRIIESRMP